MVGRAPKTAALVVKAPSQVKRKTDGTFAKGSSGSPGGDAGRARKALNLDTVREMHLAFQRGGRKAIDKVMRQQPAVFLKLLVLLVPRELQVEHTQGVKGMSTEQIEQAITVIEEMLARRSGDRALDVTPGLPPPPGPVE